MPVDRGVRISEALLPEAQDFLASLLRELPDNVRGALSDWYTTGESVEAICQHWSVPIGQLAETRRELRSRVDELPGNLKSKPPASERTRTFLGFSRSA